MPRLVLEQTFEEPVSSEELTDAARRIDRCLEAHGAQWMRSYLSDDRKRMICEFEAADAESVRSSYRAAGVAFDACWVAMVFAREDGGGEY
ncbi:MAG: nickel-binding protein [Thermoanaerobaculia bacterium]